MRKFTKFIISVMLTLSYFAVDAQQYLEIGTHYTAYSYYYYPFYNYYKTNRNQQLYLASELGGAKIIQGIGFELQRVTPTYDDYLLPNFKVDLGTTTKSLFSYDYSWEDMNEQATVFTHSNYDPGRSTGWQNPWIDFDDDYLWTNGENLIVDISWGQMPSYCSYSNFYRNWKSYLGYPNYRVKYRYGDGTPPLTSPYASYYRSDIRVYYMDLPDPGTVNGYVTNCDGLPIWKAVVYAIDFPEFRDTTDNSGFYSFDMYSGDRTLSCFKEGFYADTAVVTIPENDIVTKNWTLTNPEISVNPLFYDVTVNPDEYYETVLSILNTGCGWLGWLVEEIVYGNDNGTPVIIKEEPRTEFPDKNADYSPMVTTVEGGTNSRDTWDLQFDFPVSYTGGTAGAESDGEFIYGTEWNGNRFFKFDIEGNLIEEFTCGGASNIRDLAYDGEFMYGAAANTSVQEMDFVNQTVISTINAPTATRAIAYDNAEDAFYSNNWSTDITLWDRDGVTISSFPVGAYNSIYGLAYDMWTEGGPFLWSYSQAGDLLAQIALPSGLETGFTFTPTASNIAGGLYTQPGLWESGLVTIGGCAQNDRFWGYELAEGGGPGPITGWLTMDYYDGMAAPNGGTDNPGVNFNATGLPSGTVVTATIILTTDPNIGTINIPATMRVAGQPLGAIEELTAEIVNMVTGQVKLTWTAVSDITFLHYVVKRDNQPIGTTTNTTYNDYLPDFGTYCYEVQAVYEEGNSAPAGPACVDWYIPSIMVDPTAMSAECWEGEMVTVEGLTVSNVGMDGSILQYHFDDPADFIHSTVPQHGSLQQGQTADIKFVYSAEGYGPGTYTIDHDVTSNDPNNPTVTVQHTLTVTTPAMIAGQVTDCNTGLPIQGAKVSVMDIGETYTAYTNNNGEYTMKVDPGTWDVFFGKLGYQDVWVYGQTVTAGNTITIDTCLYEFPYPPQFVTADPNQDDTECLVKWGLPAGPYEIVYDDGTAENFVVWQQKFGENAVKFTPAGYPCAVTGAKFYIGENFPVGGSLIGTTFGAVIYDDDGAGGMPGTKLDSIGVTVNNTGWVEAYGFNAPIEEGDFFISMVQGDVPPNTAGIGIDEEVPTSYRSYSKPVEMGWSVSIYQDFMIRAIVDGPQGTLDDDAANMVRVPKMPAEARKLFTAQHDPIAYTGGLEGQAEFIPVDDPEAARDVVKYRVIRYANFNPDDPSDMGDATTLSSNQTDNDYNDAAFGGLAMGWYKYGVSAYYTNGDWSDTTISNIVGHLMDYPVTFYVSTSDGESPEGAVITFSGNDYPYNVYTANVPDDGIVTFDSVIRGSYLNDVFLEGYFRYLLDNNYIVEETEIYVVLEEKTYPPRDLWVDPLTSIAYWNSPIVPPTMLSEDFEVGVMPPGWTTWSSGDTEWYVTQDGSSANFSIPSHTFYAVTNDDAAGSNNNGCCDYLATPVLDLRDYVDYIIRFQSFYNGAYGQLAFVEYSTDGENFYNVEQMTPSAAWEDVIVDLSAICGTNAPAYTWLAFHADDDGEWASGWAVDDVIVASASADDGPADSLEAYQVFLDGAYVATTPDSSYQYVYLVYGQTYTAGVAAQYSSGLSAMITYTFQSEYLIPPKNLAGENLDNSVYLTWDAPTYPSYNVTDPGEYIPSNEEPSLLTAPEIVNHEVEDFFIDNLPGREEGPIAWANDVQNNNFFTINVEDYTTNTIAPVSYQCFAGDFPRDFEDRMYGCNYGGGEVLIEINIDDGSSTTIGAMTCPLAGSGGIWTGMASDKANSGVMYAMATDIAQSLLCTVDVGTGTVTEIGAPQSTAPGVIEIAYNANTETMFGWCIVNDATYTIDVTTGAATELGALGFDANYAQGGSWNTYDEQVYLAAYGTGPELRILDQTTGATQLLTALAGETGLFGFPGKIGSGGPTIPENLLGYNIYRNTYEDSIAYVEHPVTEYYDFDLWPADYEYAISAVYDLTPYGFAGTGESMLEGPITVNVSYGYPLPFMEMWDYGNFEINEWDHSACDNWRVSAQAGDPAPAAEFTWDDPLTAYRCELYSYPLLGSQVEDGDVYLDFDIKLDDRKESATERLSVSIWVNEQLTKVTEFVNEGDIDWTHHSFKISDAAKGKDFRLVFIAEGDSSVYIQGWYLDNIHVYQYCAPPVQVESEFNDDPGDMYVEIKWIDPYSVIGEWIGYNDGSFENGFASTNGGYGLGQLFQVEDFPLVAYPFTITKVRYFNDDYGQPQQAEEVYVLSGDGGTILAGPYEIINGPTGDWVEIEIDPVVITQGNFMIATINVAADGPFVGVDDSYYNGTLFFGTMGDWTELGELGPYYYVGSHEAYVETEISGTVVMNSENSAPKPGNIESSEVAESFHGGVPSSTNSSREITGFNIYRNIDGGDWVMINDELVPESPYIDDDLPAGDPYMACYYVQAIFDQCESDSSNNTCQEINFVSVDEYDDDGMNIYPNPADDLIHIASAYDINKITMMNYLGQLVDQQNTVEDNQIELNVSTFEEGVYFLKIETAEGTVTKKVTITR